MKKKFILSLLTLLFCALSGKAQFVPTVPATPIASSLSIVQEKGSTTSSTCNAVTTCSVTFTSSVVGGHGLVYFSASETGTGTLNACTDTTGGSSLNTIATALNLNLNSGTERVSYVANSNAGTTVVTCTTTTAANIHIHVWEMAGTNTSTPLDLHESHTLASTTQNYTSTGTTAFANEIVFGFYYDRANNDTLSAAGGFSPSVFINGGSGNESSLTESLIVSSTGTQTIQATCASGTNTVVQILVTFH